MTGLCDACLYNMWLQSQPTPSCPECFPSADYGGQNNFGLTKPRLIYFIEPFTHHALELLSNQILII